MSYKNDQSCGMDAAVSNALAEVLPTAKLRDEKSTWMLIFHPFPTKQQVNSNSLSLSSL